MTDEESDKKCLNCSRMTVSQDEYISGMEDKITKLEKENEEMKEALKNNTDTASVIQLMELIQVRQENAVQKAQIEKMKCCGNCKNLRKDFGLCFYSGGDDDYFCRLRKWELAE